METHCPNVAKAVQDFISETSRLFKVQIDLINLMRSAPMLFQPSEVDETEARVKETVDGHIRLLSAINEEWPGSLTVTDMRTGEQAKVLDFFGFRSTNQAYWLRVERAPGLAPRDWEMTPDSRISQSS